jgi:hypothetical protein
LVFQEVDLAFVSDGRERPALSVIASEAIQPGRDRWRPEWAATLDGFASLAMTV